MAASVRIEDEAFSDVRYEVLATLCLLADADHARGKMAKLWRQCTAQHAYVLPVSTVCAVLGENAAHALTESGLGESVSDGIRIRGTRGRIEWLRKLRKNAQKGGKAKAAKRQTLGKQEAAKSVPPPFPPAPAPAPVKEEDLSAPAAPETKPNRKPKSCKAQVPVDWVPSDALGLSASEREQLARFRDHHRSKGNSFADIEAAWRNWKRRAPEFTPFNGAAPKSQKAPAPDDDEPQLSHLLCLGAPP